MRRPGRGPRRVRLWLAAPALAAVGALAARAAFPVIDVGSIAQLVSLLGVAQDQLDKAQEAYNAAVGATHTLTQPVAELLGDKFALVRDAAKVTGAMPTFAPNGPEVRRRVDELLNASAPDWIPARRRREADALPTEAEVRATYPAAERDAAAAEFAEFRRLQALRQVPVYAAEATILAAAQRLDDAADALSEQADNREQGPGAYAERTIAGIGAAARIQAAQLELMIHEAHAGAAEASARTAALHRAEAERIELRAGLQTQLAAALAAFDAGALDRAMSAPVLPAYGMP